MRRNRENVALVMHGRQDERLTKLLESCIELFVFGNSALLSALMFLQRAPLSTYAQSSKLSVKCDEMAQIKRKEQRTANLSIFTVDDVPLP